ncbi:sporulation membrane protein YtaF [Anaeropeptidivorans aminofermentans]|uniref:sporulation membrane protein YtaF n=1 Tax=Anaeropeptidivorans aminofermentans TaxID=2934315 RepID=UPI00202434C3|nr:sporulation membrane protein YtaF [Anaeropeptidivorans aminofermentans]
MYLVFLEALMLASALSLDAFIASFAYGSNKIKIPFSSVQVINIICSVILGISLLAGSFVRGYIPESVTALICFFILCALGVVKLLDSMTKTFIRKHTNFNKEIRFSMLNFKFILSLYADPEKADVDDSKLISHEEAASLAVALSLDGLAVGFGAALGNVDVWAVIFCSFIVGTLAVISGHFIGERVAKNLSVNLSWLSGIMLIVLAFLKLM